MWYTEECGAEFLSQSSIFGIYQIGLSITISELDIRYLPSRVLNFSELDIRGVPNMVLNFDLRA